MPRGPGYRQPSDWKQIRNRILSRDRHTCYQCGAPATTVDHVVAVSQGGSHEDDNLAAICWPCHKVKSEAERVAGIRRRAVSKRRSSEQHPNSRR